MLSKRLFTMPKPFPRRTIFLMVLALAAFARLYWVSHQDRAGGVAEVHLVTVVDGGFLGAAP